MRQGMAGYAIRAEGQNDNSCEDEECSQGALYQKINKSHGEVLEENNRLVNSADSLISSVSILQCKYT